MSGNLESVNTGSRNKIVSRDRNEEMEVLDLDQQLRLGLKDIDVFRGSVAMVVVSAGRVFSLFGGL